MESKIMKPLWWSIFILAASIIYLIPEAIFNAELVNIAGGKAVDDEMLKNVEFFGRFISGIGVGLLLIDLLIPKHLLSDKKKTFWLIALIMSLTWPVVFFGQKALIDALIVNSSTQEQRQHAVLSTVVKDSLIEESVVIKGLDYNSQGSHTAVEKTFLSLIGVLVYSNDRFIDKLDENKETIVRNMINNKMTANFDVYYSSFSDLRETIKEDYKEYRSASRELNDAIREKVSNPDAFTKEYWSEVRKEISSGWENYKNAQNNFDATIRKSANVLTPKLIQYFETRNKKCDLSGLTGSRVTRCHNLYDVIYKEEAEKNGIQDIALRSWLIKDGSRYRYTNDKGHYESVLKNHRMRDFSRRSGYPYGLNVREFNEEPKTRKIIVDNFKEKGITLPSSWTVNDRATFNRAVIEKMVVESEGKWRNEISENTNMDVAPNLSWERFKRLPEIQEIIYAHVPEKYKNYSIDIDWNNEDFYRNAVFPIVESETKDYLDLLASERRLFGDGEKYSVVGKDALRAIMVPPISMGISLFLVILTLFKIPFKIYEVIMEVKEKPINRRYVYSGYAGCLVLALLVPSFISTNNFTQDDNAVSYFFEEIKNEKTSLGSYALKWVLSVQPVIQPLGDSLERVLHISEGFESINGVFESMDNSVFSNPYQDSSYKPLFINKAPNYAIVRIMNITPKYYDGMVLQTGTYDVEVSATGYETMRRNVELDEENKFNFILEKK